jgi:hypothetical protein
LGIADTFIERATIGHNEIREKRLLQLDHLGLHDRHLGFDPVFDNALAHAERLLRDAETPGFFTVTLQESEYRLLIGRQAKGKILLACADFKAQGDDVPLVAVLAQDRCGTMGGEALVDVPDGFVDGHPGRVVQQGHVQRSLTNGGLWAGDYQDCEQVRNRETGSGEPQSRHLLIALSTTR